MNGIPVKIRRDGHDETVYLSCARVGPVGTGLNALKHDCRVLFREALTAEKAIALTLATAKALDKRDASEAEIQALSDRQDKLIAGGFEIREKRIAASQDLWLAALRPNHGADSEEIVNCLTENQVLAILPLLERGETPADFFPSNEPPTSAKSGAPSGASTSGSCLPPDSAKATSKPDA